MPDKKQLYILDTNVLVEDPEVIFKFSQARVGIPIIVLEELDKIKGESSSRGASARMIVRHLDKIRSLGSLKDGVKLENGTIVQIVFEDLNAGAEKLRLNVDIADNKILMIAYSMLVRGYDVVFITKDINARIKADAIGLKSQDYVRGLVLAENYYKGWQEFQVSGHELRQELPNTLKELAENNGIVCNEFVVLMSKGNEFNNRVFRYKGGMSFKEVVTPVSNWPIEPKNVYQMMALDLLFDNDISVVTFTGPAGTGKTFLTLFVGLYNVLISEQFYKMTIARSVVPLGHDIGFLPGDVQEKLRGWMQPMYDNFDMISEILKNASGHDFYNNDDMSDQYAFNFEERRFGKNSRKSPKRQMFKKGSQGPKLGSLDDLISQRKVSLEAISYMRGRSIARQFIFIDEAQNLTLHEIKTLLSRVAIGSKIILSGDPYQIDVPYLDFSTNGLVVATDRFRGQPVFGGLFLPISERSDISRLAQELL